MIDFSRGGYMKAIYFLAILVFILSACNFQEKHPSLIGTWISEGESYQTNPDGTETLVGKITWEHEFTENGKFLISTSDSLGEKMISNYKILNDGQIQVDGLAEILFGSSTINYEFTDSNTLILSTSAGSREFTRVR
jgi:hypothetical protein